MASPILTVIGLVMDKLVEQAWPDLTWAFGTNRGKVALSSPEPFVAWCPSEAGDRFGPVDPSEDEPHALRTITTRLEAHVRGGTFETTEALRHDLASIVFQQLSNDSGELVGGGWLDAGNALTSRTEVYILLVDLKAPITEQLHGQDPTTTVVVETVDVASEIDIPGGSVEPDVTPLPLPPQPPPTLPLSEAPCPRSPSRPRRPPPSPRRPPSCATSRPGARKPRPPRSGTAPPRSLAAGPWGSSSAGSITSTRSSPPSMEPDA